MDEYIRKSKAIAHPFANGCYDKKNASKEFIMGHESYKEWLEDLPADPDVIKIVRCKDCKYRPTGKGYNHDLEFPEPGKCPCECEDFWYSWNPPDDWFCAAGERKKDNG